MKEIVIMPWVRRGKMIVNAYALDHDDKDHPYNQALRQGANPEDFDISNPLEERFGDKTRGELIRMIVDLETEVLASRRMGY